MAIGVRRRARTRGAAIAGTVARLVIDLVLRAWWVVMKNSLVTRDVVQPSVIGGARFATQSAKAPRTRALLKLLQNLYPYPGGCSATRRCVLGQYQELGYGVRPLRVFDKTLESWSRLEKRR